MPKKEGLGFSVDERTEVPTYEEIASVFGQHKNKFKKPLKYFLFMIVLIALVGGIGGTAYVYRDNIQGGAGTVGSSLTGLSISGFMTNNIDYSNKDRFGYKITEITINLSQEEQSLTSNLTSSLTTTLSSTCEQQKTSLAVDIRTQEKTECTTAKNALETKITSWKDKYTACQEASGD